MADLQTDPEHASGTLVVDGNLTISEVTGFKAQLMKAFDQAGKVTVDLTALTAIDIAGLQLLCATHRYAVATGHELQLLNAGNLALVELAGKAGISCESVCSGVEDDACPMSVLND